jgi:nicotinamide riboside transporter PnuC
LRRRVYAQTEVRLAVAVVIVLSAFVATSIQAFGGDNNSILTIIAAIGGLLSNIAASRQKYITGALNPWFAGLVTAAGLYVSLNAIAFAVGLSLLSEEGQFVQRNAPSANL